VINATVIQSGSYVIELMRYVSQHVIVI